MSALVSICQRTKKSQRVKVKHSITGTIAQIEFKKSIRSMSNLINVIFQMSHIFRDVMWSSREFSRK
jgi:hypothetical protein